MPTILPVSDLRNYNEVLRHVSKDNPVYLTRNGRGCYAIVDIDEYEDLRTWHLRRTADTENECPADKDAE
jgi:prevent-host-death family protein